MINPNQAYNDQVAARWTPARSPHLLETSLPGVFAIGGVHTNSIERAGAAVGEGPVVVSFVHQIFNVQQNG